VTHKGVNEGDCPLKGENNMIYEKLAKIQTTLKAPKNQFNSFGKYHYRSCEDILEAVKPLLDGAVLTLSDKIVQMGDRYYVEATAVLSDGKESVANRAYAREDDNRKGMDSAQLTGATSSYARKYALAGLFLLDDNKDSDATNEHGKGKDSPKPAKEEVADKNVSEGKPAISVDAMRQEMAKWFDLQYGPDSMTKFKEMCKGTFDNPMTIKTDKNVAIAYKYYLELKEATINA
jgi:hypothetical protein